MRRGWILIAGACALAYANSLNHGFHYDDEHSIVRNIHLHKLANIPAFFADPRTFSADPDKAMYRPLLLVTYAINYALGGEKGFGYHLVNLLIHGLNACLVWWLTQLLGGRLEVALLAGLLFALHPLGTEPVNYISSRSESLAACFYLLGLGWFAQAGERRGRRVGSWLAFALGLLAKEIAITLPAVLLLYDYLFVSRRQWKRLGVRLWRWHGPYWLIAMAYLVLIWNNGFLSGSLRTPVRDGWTQLLTQIKAFAYYLRMLPWPLPLNVEHQFFAQSSLEGGAVWGALLLLLSFLALLVCLYRQGWDLPLFLSSWALLALLPVMVMPLNVLVNERRLYLSCAAFCLGLAMALGRLQASRGGRWRILGFSLGLFYGILSFSRNSAWADDFSLWEAALDKAPLMPRIHLYLGNAHKDAARHSREREQSLRHWREAAHFYQRTLELDRDGELGLRALNNLGSVYLSLGDLDTAERAYRQAIERSPRYGDALVNLGSIYHERGRREAEPDRRLHLLAQAIDYYQRALDLLPNHAPAYANLGLAYFELGDLAKAQQAYERAYYLNPNDELLLNNLGNLSWALAQRTSGDQAREFLLQARRFYGEAIRINPAYPFPQRGLQQVEQRLRELSR